VTIVEANSKLFEWFSKHDSFVLKEDGSKDNFKDIVLITDAPEAHRAAVMSALDECVKSGMVCVQKMGTGTYWNLIRPFADYPQSITLDVNTITILATTINTFCAYAEDKEDLCDPMNIKCKDIQNLAFIAAQLGRAVSERKESAEE